VPHLWHHRSKQPIHTACAGGFFSIMTVVEEKRALRERLVRARAALPPDEHDTRSGAAARVLASLPAWQRARTVALYAPLGAEVDTALAAELASIAGKRLAWPRLRPDMLALEFATCAPADLVAGPLRALEPPAGAPRVPIEDVDLLVVPGVGFDATGHRLGRGRGHYDATLALAPRGTLRVGLSFELQLVPEVPCEPHDARLDLVVTEERVLAEGAARR